MTSEGHFLKTDGHLMQPVKERIESRITELKSGLAALQADHDKMANEHNARCQQVDKIARNNFAKMQQFTGAINELEALKETLGEEST